MAEEAQASGRWCASPESNRISNTKSMKLMNKRRFIASSAIALAVLAAPVHAAKKESLNIFCWSEYIPQSVIDGFSKKFNVKVNVENYASNEEMLAKLQAGGSK